MAFLPKRIVRSRAKAICLDGDRVWDPLMMKTWRRNRFRQRHAVIDDVHEDLQHGGNDGRTSWRSRHKNRLAVS